jgi:hypothetical protein
MTGALRVSHGQVSGLSLLDQIAALTNHPDLRTLQLHECAGRFTWEKSDCRLTGMSIEEQA